MSPRAAYEKDQERNKPAVSYESKKKQSVRPANRSAAYIRKQHIKALNLFWADSRDEPARARVMIRIRPALHAWVGEYCSRAGLTVTSFLEAAIRREIRYRMEFYGIGKSDPNLELEIGTEVERSAREETTLRSVIIDRTD